MLDEHRSEVTNPHRKRDGEPVGERQPHRLRRELPILFEANVDRCIYGQRGSKNHTFEEMWEQYSQYLTQKDRPEQSSDEQRDMIL